MGPRNEIMVCETYRIERNSICSISWHALVTDSVILKTDRLSGAIRETGIVPGLPDEGHRDNSAFVSLNYEK